MLTKKTTILTLLNAGLFLTFNVVEIYYIFRFLPFDGYNNLELQFFKKKFLFASKI